MSHFLKTKMKLTLWVMLSVLAGVFLASSALAFLKNNHLELWSSQALVIQPFADDTVAKPKYFYTTKDSGTEPKISAEAYIVGDLNTGEVIMAKNQDAKRPIASMSKLMTAFVANEVTDINDTAEVSSGAVSASGRNGGLRAGEKIKTSDLLYPLLLESSNDAAEALAEHFGRDSFISKMNQQAQNLKMASTNFEDPSGLSAGNQSTASDMFRLVGYLRGQKPELLAITTKRSFSNKKHSWSNISQFLGDDGYIGGKSGYTDAAQQTVVSMFDLPLGESGLRPIAITLLGSSDRHRDVETILKYLKKNIYYGGEADANTNWVAEKIGAPDIKDPNFVTLTFGGDIMLDRGVKSSVIRNFGNDYSALFEKLAKENSLKKSDINFANLEGPASDQGEDQKNLYAFRMDPAVIPALAGAGINILSVANNHVADWGRPAYADTLANLKENEILYTGGGNNAAEAEAPTIIEKYGMKIGFLGFSDQGPDYMQAEAGLAGILSAKNPRFDEIISSAAKQVDYLVVSFHFGEEYQAKHNVRQAELAHRAVDDGAKLIIGAHPHVVQDMEVYARKDCTQSSCMSFIAYSLGNFIFDQSFSASTMQGMLLNVKLGIDGTMTVRKDTVKLNSAFQPDQIVRGKEEKVKFQEVKAN
ncbi:MAG TPA: CapA family protein [Candidatus Paceibacterota bacterium]|jgi:poly-gamma-glutamate synthesis protein (capsule biosynthesis protein)|nr:CapA family protein [Candidatus Paceibacterota bacterium]